ncbi:hypothetical protein OH76DRAFT_1418481 [Lentinus brumalis]|uniref:Uncharacterized protein n=1 Tax=Lentinus brumalis TaxID=2498619 RepID=A0A371DAE1_9APHY|nr:hypothetical protein OH76DRAFT_1418481 [Polyporus brumalis]
MTLHVYVVDPARKGAASAAGAPGITTLRFELQLLPPPGACKLWSGLLWRQGSYHRPQTQAVSHMMFSCCQRVVTVLVALKLQMLPDSEPCRLIPCPPTETPGGFRTNGRTASRCRDSGYGLQGSALSEHTSIRTRRISSGVSSVGDAVPAPTDGTF